MPIEVSQLRPEGMDAAIEFAKSAGCELEGKTVDPMVSLIASEKETIVASVLGTHQPGGACELHVCLSKLEDPDALIGDLLNKALMKVHGAGTRRCQIHHHGPDETPANWLGEKWTGQEVPAGESACSTETAPEVDPISTGDDSATAKSSDTTEDASASIASGDTAPSATEQETKAEMEVEADAETEAA